MPVLGRQLVGSPDDGILRDVDLDPAITSANLGRFVLYSGTDLHFNLISGINGRELASSIMGMLVRVGSDNKGDVQTRGPASYSGALVGQSFYLDTDGTNKVGVPALGQWVRLGYCTRANVMTIDMDIEEPKGIMDSTFSSVEVLETVDPDRFHRMYALVNNIINSDENGLYQSQEITPSSWSWIKVMTTSTPNMFTHQFLSRRS